MTVIKGVLFDLDGTLLDSAPDLVASVNLLRTNIGLPPMPVEDLRHFVSRGAVGMIKAGLPPGDEETQEARRLAFLDHYAANSYVHSRPFDGVEDLLAVLAERGIPWAIVTNKMESLTLPILKQVGWLDKADAIVCGDTFEHNKPHPMPVTEACRMIGVAPENALMVGDDRRDVESGVSAGCATALALFGYAASDVDSELYKNCAMLETPADVLQLI